MKTCHIHSAGAAPMRGFTLIEVLIAMLIMSFGLLSIAATQMRAQHAELESYQRSQALILLDDLYNRITTNRDANRCYAITDPLTGSPWIGQGNTQAFGCSGWGTTSTRAMADADIAAVDALLKGATETLAGSRVGTMSGARACISFDPVTDVYTLAIAWQGSVETIVPTNRCATGNYGTDSRRRVVTRTVEFADLG